MKRLLLLLPFALAGCAGEKTTTVTAPTMAAPSASSASRSNGEDGSDRRSSTVVVSPANMHGWAFYDDNTDGPCLVTTDCRMVFGPKNPPLGVGSAELAANVPTERNYLGLYGRYNGVPFSTITTLSYFTYRQTPPDPNPLAITLQFNVDYNLSDANNAYQGRVVFEPYLTGATVLTGTWQSWDAMAGRGWWSSNPVAAAAANPTAVPCTQATPCTWAELVARYPNAGVHATFGAVLLKAGGSWAGFRGNTDALTIGVAGSSTTYDFEPVDRSGSECKNGGWRTMQRADGTPFRNQGDCVSNAKRSGEGDEGNADEDQDRTGN
jgi:hypothetical protein